MFLFVTTCFAVTEVAANVVFVTHLFWLLSPSLLAEWAVERSGQH